MQFLPSARLLLLLLLLLDQRRGESGRKLARLNKHEPESCDSVRVGFKRQRQKNTLAATHGAASFRAEQSRRFSAGRRGATGKSVASAQQSRALPTRALAPIWRNLAEGVAGQRGNQAGSSSPGSEPVSGRGRETTALESCH